MTAAVVMPEFDAPMAKHEPSRGSKRLGHADAAVVVAAGFDALVSGLRNASRSNVLTGFRSNSPELMFEPAADDAHVRRQAALERDYQEGVEKSASPYRERTDLRTSDEPPGPSNSGGSRSSDSTILRPSLGSSMSFKAGVEAKSSTTAGARDATRFGSPDVYAAARANDHHTIEGVTPTVNSANPKSAEIVPLVGAAAPLTSAPAGNSPSTTPAQQVGEILGATRVSGVESARAASGTALSSNAGGAPRFTPEEVAQHSKQPNEHGSAARSPLEARSADDASRFERLVQSIRLQTGERVSSARLHLMPPELGRMRVDVRVEGNQIEIRVRTENDEARNIVGHRAEQLAAALEEHGLRVIRLDILSHESPPEGSDHPLVFDESASRSDQGPDGYEGSERREWPPVESTDLTQASATFPISETYAVLARGDENVFSGWSVATESRLDIMA